MLGKLVKKLTIFFFETRFLFAFIFCLTLSSCTSTVMVIGGAATATGIAKIMDKNAQDESLNLKQKSKDKLLIQKILCTLAYENNSEIKNLVLYSKNGNIKICGNISPEYLFNVVKLTHKISDIKKIKNKITFPKNKVNKINIDQIFTRKNLLKNNKYKIYITQNTISIISLNLQKGEIIKIEEYFNTINTKKRIIYFLSGKNMTDGNDDYKTNI